MGLVIGNAKSQETELCHTIVFSETGVREFLKESEGFEPKSPAIVICYSKVPGCDAAFIPPVEKIDQKVTIPVKFLPSDSVVQ